MDLFIDFYGDLLELIGKLLSFLVDIWLIVVVSACVLETASVVDADIGSIDLLGWVDADRFLYLIELKWFLVVMASTCASAFRVACGIRFIDTWVFLIGKELKFLKFVEIGLFFSVCKASICYYSVLVGLN